jgi:glycosyltransferase involved in cell wall biosynthesis
MAAGTVPVIRNWDGAAELYPPEYVFETVDDAVRSILDLLGSGRLEEHREQCRDYARERFDRRVIIAAFEELLGEILSATISS